MWIKQWFSLLWAIWQDLASDFPSHDVLSEKGEDQKLYFQMVFYLFQSLFLEQVMQIGTM